MLNFHCKEKVIENQSSYGVLVATDSSDGSDKQLVYKCHRVWSRCGLFRRWLDSKLPGYR